MEIKINTHGNPLPESHGEWVDLATAEDVELGNRDRGGYGSTGD